jgi:hypothetical protein
MKTTLLLTALVSATALAQAEAPPPPPPAAPPAATATTPADAPVEMDPGNRFRWGFSINLGWNIPAPAFVGGAEVHLGWQFSNMFAAYAILGTNFGLGFNASVMGSAASGGITAFGSYYGGLIAELMLADIFYVGGGALAGADGYGGVQVGVNAGSGSQQVQVLAHNGFMFGFDARFGLGFGRAKPSPSFRRGGFNLGIDVMAILRPNTVIVTQTADANGNFGVGVTTNGLTASVIPMLTLGYDAR